MKPGPRPDVETKIMPSVQSMTPHNQNPKGVFQTADIFDLTHPQRHAAKTKVRTK